MKLRRLLISIALSATFTLSAQWGIGMRDTRYINVSYSFFDHWSAKFEHSVYSEKFSHQYIRLYLAYSHHLCAFTFSGESYFGMTYNNSYRSLGFNIDAEAKITSWLFVGAGFTPHYDSGMGYKSLYKGYVGFNCSKNIAIIGCYTNRPEFRMPEKRIRGGVRFMVHKLWVQPEISIPVTNSEGKSIRFLASMGFKF